VIANRHGTVVRVLDGSVAWLGPAFTTEASRAIDQSITDIAIDDAGGTAISVGTYVDVQEMQDYTWRDAAVIGLGPDHVQRWRAELGNIYNASVAASSTIIALDTDATHVDGVTIATAGSPRATLVALRASDGSVLWHHDKPILGAMAFAPDGTLIIGATFSGTLDLGGATTPLTTTGIDGVVAALDPMTGDGIWAVQLDSMGTMRGELGGVAVGPAGEVAATWTTDIDAVPASVMLIDAGVVRWTQPATRAEVYAPIVTDGEHVVTSGVGFAQHSASGTDWQRPIAGPGTHIGQVLALDTRLIGSIYSAPVGIGDPPVSTTIGDVTYDGDGIAVVELTH
jgi:outer membrane protein assembly factor BamB